MGFRMNTICINPAIVIVHIDGVAMAMTLTVAIVIVIASSRDLPCHHCTGQSLDIKG